MSRLKTLVSIFFIINLIIMQNVSILAVNNTVGDITLTLTVEQAEVIRGQEFEVKIDISGELDSRGIFVITSGVMYDSNAFEPVAVNGKYANAGTIIPAAGASYLTSAPAVEKGNTYISVNYGMSDETAIKQTGIFAILRFRTKQTAQNGEYPIAVFNTGIVNYIYNNGDTDRYNPIKVGSSVKIISSFTINVPGSVYVGESITLTGHSDQSSLYIQIKDSSGGIFYEGTIDVVNSQYSTSIPLVSNAVLGDYSIYISDNFSAEHRIITVKNRPIVTPPSPPPTEETHHHTPYIYGYPDGTYRIENNISREEIAMILYRLIDNPEKEVNPSGSTPFNDVSEEMQSFNSIMYLYKIGVINGYPDGTFKPWEPITRAEIVKMICVFKGFDLNSGDRFWDVKSNNWAYRYIASVADEGIIIGYPDGSFAPDSNTIRAEVISAINRMLLRKTRYSGIPLSISLSDVSREHWAFADVAEATKEHYFIVLQDGFEQWINK